MRLGFIGAVPKQSDKVHPFHARNKARQVCPYVKSLPHHHALKHYDCFPQGHTGTDSVQNLLKNVQQKQP